MKTDNIFFMLIHKEYRRIYILKLSIHNFNSQLIPRQDGDKAGMFDLYFHFTNEPLIHVRYLSSQGYNTIDITNKIVTTLDLNGDDVINDTSAKSFIEGNTLEVQHRSRERNRSIVEAAKMAFKRQQNGEIFCEIYHFNFQEVYGIEYIEVHHKKPISEMKESEETHLDDIYLVCPNCHRIIHSKSPCLSLEEVRILIATNDVNANTSMNTEHHENL